MFSEKLLGTRAPKIYNGEMLVSTINGIGKTR
jgi:hypothetical protein